MKARKKPVIVDAWPWPEVPVDVTSNIIHTLEGDMTRNPGDWLIRGVSGEYYPCKPDIFEATYEIVEEGE